MNLDHLKGKIAIVGVGYTPQGKVPGRTAVSFHAEAVRNALTDAGIDKTSWTVCSYTGTLTPLQGIMT